jgi:hypothetical protein
MLATCKDQNGEIPIAVSFTRHSVAAMLAAIAAISCSAPTGDTQPLSADAAEISVPDEASCSVCSIELQQTAELGHETGAGQLGRYGLIQRNTRGEYVVVTVPESFKIILFDSVGQVSRVRESRGSGPGEFQTINALAATSDRVYVFDTTNRRLTILDYQLEPIKTAPIVARITSMLPLDKSSMAIAAVIPTTERIGYALHLIDADGQFMHSMGSSADPAMQLFDNRALAPDTGSGFWSLSPMPYRIDRWSRDGALVNGLRRVAPWLDDSQQPTGAPDEPTPPPSKPWKIHASKDGLVWTLSIVPDARWRQAIARGRGGWIVTDNDRYYDTIIEVIDPNKARVVTRRRVDMYLHTFADATHVAAPFVDKNEIPRFRVFALKLTRQS